MVLVAEQHSSLIRKKILLHSEPAANQHGMATLSVLQKNEFFLDLLHLKR